VSDVDVFSGRSGESRQLQGACKLFLVSRSIIQLSTGLVAPVTSLWLASNAVEAVLVRSEGDNVLPRLVETQPAFEMS